jgi:dienelactone hydrolase
MEEHPNKLNKLLNNPIIRTLVIFVSGGWIVLEITEYFISNFGLNEAVRKILLIILLSVFPIILFLAWYSFRNKAGNESNHRLRSISVKRRKIIIPTILIILAFGTTFSLRSLHQSKVHKALQEILPSLQNEKSLVNVSDGYRNWIVYQKAIDLKKILGTHADFQQFWNDITVELTITSEPEGASVYSKPYSKPDTSWTFMGTTPLVENSFPRGVSRIKIEKAGFDVQYDMLYNSYGYHDPEEPRHYILYQASQKPEGMLHAMGFKGGWIRTGGLPERTAGDFWIDKCEVTNKAYKSFVEAGGYTNSDYWKQPFIEGEDTLSWEMAMERFRDQTGWPGPAQWVLGDHASGKENHPVSGISWYEAAAYAEYAEKEIPTIYHWTYLAEIHAAPEIAKFGNFNKTGTVEVGSNEGIARYGVLDMAGNVSEWVFNSSGSMKFIVGGSYLGPRYRYNNRSRISPWTRSELIGFRCMRYLNDTLKQDLTETFNNNTRNLEGFNPVSDEAFDIMKDLYRYEKKAINARIISTEDASDWTQENVLVDVPYENTPLQISVFIPKNSHPPYQTVIYFPHDGPRYSQSIEDLTHYAEELSFLVKSGRVVVFPVYYNTFGRGEIEIKDLYTWRQTHIFRVIDFQIACDYLESRTDIEMDKLAYAGVSWGGWYAPYFLAVEDRIKLGILVLFGASLNESPKDIDQLNYIPRVKVPMLLLDGRYDFAFSMESQQAFYDLLGTPLQDKEWKLYETTHVVPLPDLVNESLKWLDKYFGPVELE